MISVALRVKVGASPTTCCLMICCVKVEPPLDEPNPTSVPKVARITAFGTTPLCSVKCSSSVAMMAFFRLSDIASDATEVRNKSPSIEAMVLPSA